MIINRNKKYLEKFGYKYPKKLKKRLSKIGYSAIIMDEEDLNNYNHRYVIKTLFTCTEGPPDRWWYILTTTNQFYDNLLEKEYEIFMPINYNILDLMKKIEKYWP